MDAGSLRCQLPRCRGEISRYYAAAYFSDVDSRSPICTPNSSILRISFTPRKMPIEYAAYRALSANLLRAWAFLFVPRFFFLLRSCVADAGDVIFILSC